jgi:hypothetical protein
MSTQPGPHHLDIPGGRVRDAAAFAPAIQQVLTSAR